MTDDEQVVEEMATVYALISARLQNDKEAWRVILSGDEDIGPLFISLIDFAIALLKQKASELQIPVETLVRSMAGINQIFVPEILREMRKNGR